MQLKKLLIIFVLLFVLTFTKTALAQSVSKVYDGDTITVNSNQKIRLSCIDAPELSQKPYGQLAKAELAKLLPVDSAITIVLTDQKPDRYGRFLALVYNKEYILAQQRLVRNGLAVVYAEYQKNCPTKELLDAEQQAKNEKLGIWSEANTCLPGAFRKKLCQ